MILNPKHTRHHMIPVDAELVFSGVRADLYQWNQEMYDGSIARFERIRFLDGAFCVPILPSGNILMTRQEQPGRKLFLSLPGGIIDPTDISPLEGARRELREETGYMSDMLILWTEYSGTSNVLTYAYYFIARDCYYVGPVELDGGEKIELFEVTFDEFLELSSNPEFHHHASLLPILYEARLYPEKKKALWEIFYRKGNAGLSKKI